VAQLIDHKTLLERQAWNLDRKVNESLKRISEWYEAFGGQVSISFSGGLDSTVLVDLVRSIYPEVPAVFCNTGLEYPENVLFVKSVPNATIVRPSVPFHKVVEKWGYPLISKRVAQYLHEVRTARGDTPTKRLRLTGIKSDGTLSPMSMIPQKWQYLINAPFKISDKCCLEIKKKPTDRYMKETGRVPYVGTLAEESQQRTQTYYTHGCNRFDSKRPASNPLSFWTHKDVVNYINQKQLRYSKIYDMGHKQTGCMFCLFGVHLDYQATGTNRFVLMKEQHPRHWDYCINRLGIGTVMNYIGVPYEDKQLKLWAT
jgi:3'-phosphoadenosine 5'-phosphosulfate sulfotransferase (PAPS reductase)/FAD synthetase